MFKTRNASALPIFKISSADATAPSRFFKISLDIQKNLFDDLSESVEFEDVVKGRKASTTFFAASTKVIVFTGSGSLTYVWALLVLSPNKSVIKSKNYTHLIDENQARGF